MNATTTIELFDKREKVTSTMYVERLGENKFRMVDNDIFNCRLTLGAEFETRINAEGKHEVVRITKESGYVTRRFFLSSKHKKSDYEMIADELLKHGGFWQVDLGSILTVNLPENFPFDADKVMKDLDIVLTEIIH